MSNISSEMEPDMFYNHNHLFTILVLVFTTLVGVPGNALVLWVTGVKMKWSVTTIWFWNLAVADIICCLCIPFTLVQYFYSYWLYGPFLCKVLHIIVPLNMFASVFTLVVISIDRCILVVQPIWARNHRKAKRAWMICLVIWILSFMMTLPKLLYQTIYIVNNRSRCNSSDHNAEAVTYTHMVFGFLLPLLIISTCYIAVSFKLKNSRFSEVGKKITKVALGIIVAFFITWAPYHIMNVIVLFPGDEDIIDILDLISQTLAQFNSCINPILYVFMGKDMQHKVRQSIGELLQNTFSEGSSGTSPCKRDQPTLVESVPLAERVIC